MTSRRLIAQSILLAGALALLWSAGGAPAAGADRSVNLSMDCAPLTEVARELTRQSGERHTAEGAEAKQQRVAIFCRDRPASEVREALQALLGWKWSERVVDSRKRYLLLKPPALRRQEAELRAKLMRTYESTLRGMIAIAADPEARPPGVGDAVRVNASHPLQAALLQVLRSLSDDQFRQVTRGDGFRFYIPGLSVSTRQAVETMLTDPKGSGKPDYRLGKSARIDLMRDGLGRPSHIQFTMAKGKHRREIATGHLQLMLADRPPGLMLPVGAPGRGSRVAFLQESLPEKPLGGLAPVDPATASWVGWRLYEIAARTKAPLVADCYPDLEPEIKAYFHQEPPWKPVQVGGKPLQRALEAHFPQIGYDWRVHQDRWVFLRYKLWYWGTKIKS